MADTKISALPAATTPLAGTEVLPIVQSGTTDKVSVANLTAGRDIATKQINSTVSGATTALDGFNLSNGTAIGIFKVSGATYAYRGVGSNYLWIGGDGTPMYIGTSTAQPVRMGTNAFQNFTLETDGNMSVNNAAKGVNFTANTPAAGMTSQLLNWYEEGTWTPTIGATSGTITTSGSTNCRYTRIGRTVTLTGNISITTNGTGAGGITISGLPFAAASASAGGGIAREGSVDGKTSSITQIGSTTTFAMYRYDNTYPGSDGASFNFQITYIV